MTTYITQEQAEALAHSRCAQDIYIDTDAQYPFYAHTLMDFVRDIEAAAIQAYRDSLVAGVVLPEPVAHVSDRENCKVWWSDSFTDIKQAPNNNTPLHTADQLRQTIADALCVAEKETAELRLYKHNMEARYKGLNKMLADALAKQVPQDETRKLIEECRDALAEELSGWDIDPPLAHVKEAHDNCVAWLAAAPDPKEIRCQDLNHRKK